MFKSFRKRPATPPPEPEPPRKSPSLPTLSATGLQWPADLVDPDALRSASPEAEATDVPTPGSPASPAKTSLGGPGPVPWHKPFRAMSASNGSGEHTISRLYERERAAAFDPRAGTESPVPTVTARPRRPVRAPPQFNLMVAGAQGTGKTTFLRLLLATSDLASQPTPELRAFLRGSTRPTSSTNTFAADLAEARFDRLALRVTDTPGLDVRPGRELVLERQLGALISGLEQRFKETMEEESKVIRPAAGRMDGHVHLVVYMIDPDSIVSRRERERKAHHRQHTRTQSDATVSATRHLAETSESTPPLTSDSGSDSEDEDEAEEEEEEELTMAPADLRALGRLSRRANVLPVIARADMLSDSRLARCKATVRAELAKAELDLGVFVATRSAKSSVGPEAADPSVDDEILAAASSDSPSEVSENGNGHLAVPDGEAEDESAVVEEEEEPQQRARPVIKLRTGRRASSARPTRSRSRSRIRNGSGGERSPVRIDPSEMDSVPVARFEAARVAERDLARAVPFALIMPERTRRAGNGYVGGGGSVSGHGHPDQSVSGHSQADSSFVGTGAPETLRGVFTRAYRWGTVDVLNPAHCDFAALRVAVLSTHMKMLKTHTREVLYERFRTEKLLVRRATQKIGEKEAKRLFEDLGL
ncbi:unnamed protein product [Peniophora sp. CBMAI 1063]|nr:unnamed protein product [Peniophora sp. CBMAI 1063]